MKNFKQVWMEALALNAVNKDPGKYGVSVFMGRLQPPTAAHIKIIDDAVKKYKQPVVVAVVTSDNTNSPFSFGLVKNILQASCKQKPKVLEIRSGFIGDFLSPLRDDGFEPYVLLAGSDRAKGYKAQIKRYNDMFTLQLSVKEIKRTDADISGTKVRQALVDEDESTFKSMTAKGTHKFYKKLQKAMK